MTLEQQETHIGTALALIHRALPRLDDAFRAAEVQSLLSRASAHLDRVRVALSGESVTPEPEIAAVIAAAVAVMFDQPHRVVTVQKGQVPVTQSNVWAYEGRSEIFHSHKVR